MADKKLNFFQELKRRKVYRVATVYAITGWIIIEIASATFPYLHLPDWMVTAIIVFILTGFPIAVILSWIFDVGPEGFVRTSSLEAEKNPLPANKRKPFTGIITIVILSLLLVGQFVYFRFIADRGSQADELSKDDIATVAEQLPEKSIAVLPFKNMSEDQDNAYFSDGVMEAILNNLSRIKDLKVVSRTSVEQYRANIKSIPEIASELEVANILEGSVQKMGKNVRITVQLISADKDEHIWATHYDRDISDLFMVQSEIAKTIAENLKVILTSEEREQIENAPTANLKAYDLYLKAKGRKTDTKKDIERAIDMFKEVIAMDPKFAMPYAQLGQYLSKLKRFGVPETIWSDSAMAMLEKSIALDPGYAYAYRYKAGIYKNLGEEEKVKETLLLGLHYDPNNFYFIKDLGSYYERMGKIDLEIDYMLKSLALNKPAEKDELYDQMGKLFRNIDRKMLKNYLSHALESDPESPNGLDWLTLFEAIDQNYKASLNYALAMETADPERNYNGAIAFCYLLTDQYLLAEEYFDKNQRIDQAENGDQGDQWYIPYMATTKIQLGKTEEGQALMRAYKVSVFQDQDVDLNAKLGHSTCVDIAGIYAWEKKKALALTWLEKSVETDSDWYSASNHLWLVSNPFFDTLREEEKYKHVLQKFLDVEEYRSQLFREKLTEYHKRNELKWIPLD